MPNRILFESICTSDTINQLSESAESFFYRLLVNCDDYGRMDARITVLLAKLYPLRIGAMSTDELKSLLDECQRVGLVWTYESGPQAYIQISKWDSYQRIRNMRGKYPPPPNGASPREHPLPTERDVEDLIFNHLDTIRQINGEPILSLHRQLRVEESYLDIVAKTASQAHVIEIKRSRLSNKAIDQLVRYLDLVSGAGLLVGFGLAPDFDLEKCKRSGIAVLIYSEEMLGSFVYLPPKSAYRELVGFNSEIPPNNTSEMLSGVSRLNPIQSESESESNLNSLGAKKAPAAYASKNISEDPEGGSKPLTGGQRAALDTFSAKRLNPEQLSAIEGLEKNFGTDALTKFFKWARVENMTMGHAINAAPTALAKRAHGNGKSSRQPSESKPTDVTQLRARIQAAKAGQK